MTRDEYNAGVVELADIWHDKNNPRLLELVKALEAYEKDQFPIAPPTPEQAAGFRACQEGRCVPPCEFCSPIDACPFDCSHDHTSMTIPAPAPVGDADADAEPLDRCMRCGAPGDPSPPWLGPWHCEKCAGEVGAPR